MVFSLRFKDGDMSLFFVLLHYIIVCLLTTAEQHLVLKMIVTIQSVALITRLCPHLSTGEVLAFKSTNV